MSSEGVPKFSYCSPNLAMADVYKGGAAFMAFLAADFSEDIHARLLRNPASTFEAALASETKPYFLPELFDRFRKNGWTRNNPTGVTLH